MSKVLQTAKLRVVILPLLGVVGTLVAMAYPTGHRAFCAGLDRLVL